MKNIMTRVLSFFLVCVIIFSLGISAAWASEEVPEDTIADTQTKELFDNEIQPEAEATASPTEDGTENAANSKEIFAADNVLEADVSVSVENTDESVSAEDASDMAFSELWTELIGNGGIYILEDGTLAVRNGAVADENLSTQVNMALYMINAEIRSGAFVAEYTDSGVTLTTTLTDAEQQAVLDAVQTDSGETAAMSSTRSLSPHGCGHEYIDFRGMCRSNYNGTKNIFTSIASSGYGDTFIAAVGVWVNKVREGGEWDYKSREEYKSSSKFCSCYDGAYYDITPEYMGNYNYGYTGSFLFSLDILYGGSYVAAKFNIDDIHTDWNAVRDGYYAAIAEQKNIQPKDELLLLDGEYFYFDENGKLVTGWKEISGYQYYFNSNGVARLHWAKIDGHWYYFNALGQMQLGWRLVDNKWYYFGTSGIMQTGWVNVGDYWYYMDSSGVMRTGWVKVGDYWYYFNSSGAMQTGWTKVGDYWYYLSSSGAMLTGWQTIGSTQYYFESSGDWSGWLIYGGHHYYRDPSSWEIYTKGWLKYSGYWYYLNTSTGQIFTGWLSYGGNYYYLSTVNGKMLTGWLKYGGYWYYMDSSGKMLTSQWLKYNGYWYYLKSTGRTAYSETLTINGVKYTFDSNGHWVS